MPCPKPAASVVGAGDGGGTGTSIVSAETATGWHVIKIEGFSKLLRGYHVGMSTHYGNFSVGRHSWSIECYPGGFKWKTADFVSFGLYLHRPASATDDVDVKAGYRLSILDKDGSSWVLTDFIERKDLVSTYLRSTNDSICMRCDVTVVEDICEESVVPQSDLHQHLGDLLGSEVGGDVTFQVSGEELVAHKYLLAARSSVFKAQFFGGQMKDRAATRVRIADIEARVFKAMLHFIYTDSLPDDGEDKIVMAQHLLVAADRYNIGRLKLICENTLLTFINTSVVATTLVLAEQHGCHRLKEACLKFLKSNDNFKEVGGDDYKHLMRSCPSLFDELLAEHGLSDEGNKKD
uniref:BTB domain-containing protein n=2 Tax=Setaria viridis TaxID=4556 RepID=A0A4U6TJF5_SETVI|nr:hypothetical protein SEVIR_8G205800v2 [Setaria viridis]